jgi:FtsP/CotA-like multicopper oxidase with cupredoxin domain
MTTRRAFLQNLGAAAVAGAVAGPAGSVLAAGGVTTLTATTSTVEVLGRTVRMLDILQPNGTRGITTTVGARFRVRLVNALQTPTLVHWHGLTPPPHQDGVPIVSQPALPPGQTYDYDFPLTEAGTYWMHSHEGLQEQSLLSGPLIIRDPADAARDEQEIVVELGDFSFRNPDAILTQLLHPPAMAKSSQNTAGAPAPMKRDANDVNYDAYLVNRRPIENPEVFRIEPRGRVRLRVINSASSTNFTVDLGALAGRLIAVDGRPVAPVHVNRIGIGIAQRIDLRIETPGPGVYPIFAVREADRARGAFVLASPGAQVPAYPAIGPWVAPYNDLRLESQLRATYPLTPRSPDRKLTMRLTGNMGIYSWSIDNVAWTDALALSGSAPYLPVKPGERVEITMRNTTMMTHPMHLHGHSFQVVAIGGQRFPGAMRDSVLVTPKQSVTIAFDANNPGWWFYHCHNLYHLAVGMASSVRYV